MSEPTIRFCRVCQSDTPRMPTGGCRPCNARQKARYDARKRAKEASARMVVSPVWPRGTALIVPKRRPLVPTGTACYNRQEELTDALARCWREDRRTAARLWAEVCER